MRLTEPAIAKLIRDAAAAGKKLQCRDSGCPGLELRVGTTGARTWALRCRDNTGRLRNFTLGSYSDEMGLAVARIAARRLREQVRDGADPTEDRRQARAARDLPKEDPAPTATLKAVIDIYEKHCTLKSWPHSRKRVDRVFAPLMGRAIATLTPIDLQLGADAYPAQQSASFAVRTLRPVLRWATRRGLAPKDLADIVQPATVKRRERVLSRDELADLLLVLMPADDPYRALFYFLLLTLARRDEAAGARWRDVDFERKTWQIVETKNGQPHIVPLSRQALDLLRRLGPGEPEALIFATSTGLPLGNWDRATKRIQAESGTSNWHRHDLRRTGATMLGEMGVEPHVIEAALNHQVITSQLATIYNRSRYRPAVAAALQRLADAFDRVVAGDGEIVPLTRTR
jgi:integrase